MPHLMFYSATTAHEQPPLIFVCSHLCPTFSYPFSLSSQVVFDYIRPPMCHLGLAHKVEKCRAHIAPEAASKNAFQISRAQSLQPLFTPLCGDLCMRETLKLMSPCPPPFASHQMGTCEEAVPVHSWTRGLQSFLALMLVMQRRREGFLCPLSPTCCAPEE